MNLPKYILKNYKHQRKRNSLNVLGIAAAIILLIVINFVGFNVNRIVTNYFQPFDPYYQVVAKGTSFSTLIPGVSEIPEEQLENIQTDPLFEETSIFPVFFREIRDVYEEGTVFSIFGIPIDDIQEFLHMWELADGRFPQSSHEIVIGTELSTLINNPLNSTLEIAGETYLIVGLLEDAQSLLNACIITDLSAAQSIFNREGIVSSIYFEKRIIDQIIIEHYSGNETEFEREFENRFNVEWINPTERDEISGNLISTSERLISVFMFITVLCSIIFTFSTISLNLNSRKKELANLRAIGISNKDLFSLIFGEILIIITLGLVLGIPSGYFLYAYANYSGAVFTQRGFGSILLDTIISFPLSSLMNLIFIYLGVCFISAIWPYLKMVKQPKTLKLKGGKGPL